MYSTGLCGDLKRPDRALTCSSACNQVDALFFERLNRILKIVIPSLQSKEASLLGASLALELAPRAGLIS